MNKILNWTLGSVFRTIGRVFGYLLVGGLFALIMSKSGLKITDLFGIDTINAAEITPLEVKKFYVADVTDNLINPDQQWSSAIDWGTEYNRTSETSLFLRSVRVRAGYTSKFLKGVTYKFKINVIYSNSTNGQFYKLPDTIICQGSGTSSWSSDTDLISSCKFVGREYYNNKANASYIFEFVPSADIYGVQIAWYYQLPVYNNYDMAFASVGKIRVLNSSKITYDNSTNEAINSMSDNITINQNKNTENIINNNNKNTQDIINNQNDLLGSKCSNLLDLKNFSKVNSSDTINSINEKNGSIDFTVGSEWGGIISNFIEVDSNTKYYLKGNINGATHYLTSILMYNSSKTLIDDNTMAGDNISFNFNTTNNTKYIKIRITSTYLDNYKFSKFTLNKENQSFCEYGSYQSKLDDTNNSINNLTDKMLDDTINDSDINTNYNLSNNSFGPFGTFLNLPLTWVSNILASGQTCSTIHIPLPYLENKTLDLPCMTPFWQRMGAVGALIQAFWLAVVGVKIFNGLFLLVVDTTSSKDNVDELTKLQTWEL